MNRLARLFRFEYPLPRALTWADGLVLMGVTTLIYTGARLALSAPAVVQGPAISLEPAALPWYTAHSLGRMAAAYILSILFTLVYGYLAATSRRAEKVLLPLLDILQSVPILSFLPVALLGFSAILPEGLAVELAAIVLIFTSQVWNLTFAWYQSLTTIPKELREASAIFRFGGWLRFKTLELPFAANSLIWNSVMSWAGGWFFLMAAEMFSVGERDFRLPGLGAYLQEAAHRQNLTAIAWGVGVLVLIIVLLDQLVWRPLLAWADRFSLSMVGSDRPPTAWFYDLLNASDLVNWLIERVWQPLMEWVDSQLLPRSATVASAGERAGQPWLWYGLGGLVGLGLLYGAGRAGQMLLSLSPGAWLTIGLSVGAALLRVLAALAITLAWTLPVGVAIGTNRRLATWLQPLVQIAASVPATALFPVALLFLLRLPGSLNLAAVLLMLLGTQWYMLFNIIAGASAIPQDLKYMTALLQLSRRERWRRLILPALFPFIITGAITAGGGAWNASIVVEYVEFGGQTIYTTGIGSLIARATAAGDYALLLAATLAMIVAVVLMNRLLWRRLYRLAEEQYRME